MIVLENGTRICESTGDLPALPNIVEDLYMDFETTAFGRSDEAFSPHLGDRLFAISFAIGEDAPIYIPVRHVGTGQDRNLPEDIVIKWLWDLLRRTKRWINHNVKFDAKFAWWDLYDYKLVTSSLDFQFAMIDTKCLSQTIDSDRFNHSLKPLCRDWLGMEMGEEIELKTWLKKSKTKDWARLPVDLCAKYAGMDVVGARALWKYLRAERPDDMGSLWDTEIKLTSVLFDIEIKGMMVDQQECKIAQRHSLRKMLEAAETIHDLTGMEVGMSPTIFYDILVNHLGLPVLSWTEAGNPSFDKEAMKLYAGHPQAIADEKTGKIVKALQVSRTEEHFKSLFADSFLEKVTSSGTLHSTYNQTVRTGRMSCSDPNSQQFSSRAKRLIVPRPGKSFMCYDASQVEFRIIVHYTKNLEAIAAYAANPRTDYHQWVASLCEMTRKPAKTMNFLMAYGGGMKKAMLQLSHDEDVMAAIKAEAVEAVDKQAQHMSMSLEQRAKLLESTYRSMASARAEKVYNTYHERLPEIKMTAEKARRLCATRGWVRNLMGRRRHLPLAHAHKAFNSLVQGCAMDLIKERMVFVSQRFSSKMRELGIELLGNVHDELLFEVDTSVASSKPLQEEIAVDLASTPAKLSVPLIWDYGVSSKSWKEAKE